MQPNPASSTVRGISIATIILSALGLVLSLGLLVGMGVITAYVNENSEQIVNITLSEMDSSTTSTITINNRNVDLGELAAALEKQGDADIAIVAELLDDVSKGKILDAYDLLAATDADSLIAAKHKFAAMSDEQMKQLATSVTGVTSSDMIVLREEVAGIDDNDIRELCAFVQTTTVDEMVTETVNLIMALIGFFVVLGILSELITLIAGILALRNSEKPDKLSAAFVMSIIGAVMAFLTCSLVRLVLMIIDAVYIQKVRNTPVVPPSGPVAGTPTGWQQTAPISYTTTPSQSISYPDVFKK